MSINFSVQHPDEAGGGHIREEHLRPGHALGLDIDCKKMAHLRYCHGTFIRW